MTKEGYQPIKTKKTTKIVPPNTGSHVQMKKDGYTWEDLDRSYWKGFDNAKNKIGKRIEELEEEITHLKELLLELYDCIPSSMVDSCREILQKVALVFKED